MRLCLELVSSHHLRKNDGWKDLQLCTPDYLVLRNTNVGEKKCIHYILTNSGKFVYKAAQSISALLDSIILTNATQSGIYELIKEL